MRLYLLRHGIAAGHDPARWPGDDRPLTEEGIRKTREAARAFRALDVEPARIFSSPLRRARETAEIASEALEGRPRIEITDALLPDAAPEVFARILLGEEPTARTDPAGGARGAAGRTPAAGPGASHGGSMAVGHEPHLSTLLAHLLAPRTPLDLAMKKAGLACVEWYGPPESGPARLLFLLEPGHLRAIARGANR